MDLTVIVPCLNAEATLAVQLEALAAQQWSKLWELIIADNGSTDRSVEIANTYKERFASFRIIDASGPKTASYPRNRAARVASSDKLAFCDADDEVASGWVASIGNALERYDVVHGQFCFDKFNEPHQAASAAKDWKDGLFRGRFLPGGGTGNLGIRRWVHEAISGFDECLPRFEDADYFWRLQLEGFELKYIPEAIVQVRFGRIKASLSSLYMRYRDGAASNYWHYRRYRNLGMLPPPSLHESIVSWLHVLKRGAFGASKSSHKRREWLVQLAQRTGDVVGQLQGRLTNPCKPYYPLKKGLK
jgi:glycosyltransferase involved in cell wall biosynthesis